MCDPLPLQHHLKPSVEHMGRRVASGRKGRMLPFRAASSKPVATFPLSDGERLAWERFIGPAKQAIAAVQQSVDSAAMVMLEGLMRERGLEKDEGWQFNADKLRWEQRPIPAEE